MSKKSIQENSQQQNNLEKAFNDVNNLKKTKSISYYSKNATGLTFKEKEPEQQIVNNESDEQNQTLSVNTQEALGYRFEAIESRFSEKITRSMAQIKDIFQKELSDYKTSIIMWVVILLITIGGILITLNGNSLSNLENNFNEKLNNLDNSISNIIESLK